MNRPIRSSLVLLAAAGLVSAVFTLVARFPGDVALFAVGFVFGVTLAVYLAFYEGHRSPTKIAAFICVCTAAFPLSEFAAFRLAVVFHIDGSMGSERLGIPMPVFFGAGFIGAFPVLAAGVFLFGARNMSWASLGKALLWSIAGGFLGVVGGEADSILTHGTFDKMWLLFMIWQSGAALLLGLLLIQDRRAPAARSTSVRLNGTSNIQANGGILVVAAIFFITLLGFLGYLVFRTVRSQRIIARRDLAYKRFVAEAPPVVYLPQSETLTPEQALIVNEIGGLYPWAAGAGSHGQLSPVLPPAVNYSVGYTATKDPAFNSIQRMVSVGVTQLPSAEWARYRVRYPDSNVAVDSPQSLTNVSKFGQTIIQNTFMRYPDGRGTLCFLWPSGNFVVSVCYETPQVNEEFLKQYLEKYPSSL